MCLLFVYTIFDLKSCTLFSYVMKFYFCPISPLKLSKIYVFYGLQSPCILDTHHKAIVNESCAHSFLEILEMVLVHIWANSDHSEGKGKGWEVVCNGSEKISQGTHTKYCDASVSIRADNSPAFSPSWHLQLLLTLILQQSCFTCD